MPIPTPHKDESETAFHSRCMGNPNMQEYDIKQRNAVCYSAWDEAKKSTNEEEPKT